MENKPAPVPPEGQLLIYQDGSLRVQVRIDGRSVWLTQRLMAELYHVSVKTVNEHLVNIYAEKELDPAATIRKFQIVQTEGTRQVSRIVDHYNLDAILAVGYRVRSTRGTAFRQWATARLSELLVKGFTMDDERLKQGRTLGDDYFDELLERIRDIRASERMFYQKITDIYATSIDYDVTAGSTKRFFATVQNKLHWAIHGRTASEIIYERANADKEHMGLNTWTDAPSGKIQKFDVSVAKNYLSEFEMGQLQRLVSAYLDIAEDMALRHIPMTMADWELRLNSFIKATDRDVLQDSGKVSAEIAKAHAETEFEKYRIVQDRLFRSDFDNLIEVELSESAKNRE